MSDESHTLSPLPDTDEELLAECRVETFRSGGKGGQHQNTTDSGVRLVHLPSGIRVEARRDRSQHRNKAVALGRLRAKLETLRAKPPPRVATKIPRREKAKRLGDKRKKSEVKKLRRPPSEKD